MWPKSRVFPLGFGWFRFADLFVDATTITDSQLGGEGLRNVGAPYRKKRNRGAKGTCFF